MTRLPRRLGTTLLVAGAAALLLAACASTPEAAPTPTSKPTSAAPVEPSAAPTTEPTGEPPAAPSCDELISDTMIASYQSVGWTSQQDQFRIGSREIADGVLCSWADFTAASDQIQMFGWAPIAADEAAAAQQELFANGWLEVEQEGGASVVITESPDTAISVDDQGYGQTYEFGDGWVTFADTKQNLLLIERPQG